MFPCVFFFLLYFLFRLFRLSADGEDRKELRLPERRSVNMSDPPPRGGSASLRGRGQASGRGQAATRGATAGRGGAAGGGSPGSPAGARLGSLKQPRVPAAGSVAVKTEPTEGDAAAPPAPKMARPKVRGDLPVRRLLVHPLTRLTRPAHLNTVRAKDPAKANRAAAGAGARARAAARTATRRDGGPRSWPWRPRRPRTRPRAAP